MTNAETTKRAGPDPFDIALGQRMRWRRLELQMTQADLGRKLGVRSHQIQKFESGLNRVSAAHLVRFAEALDVSILRLAGLPETRGVQASRISTIESETDEFLRRFAAIRSPELREGILQWMAVLAEEDEWRDALLVEPEKLRNAG